MCVCSEVCLLLLVVVVMVVVLVFLLLLLVVMVLLVFLLSSQKKTSRSLHRSSVCTKELKAFSFRCGGGWFVCWSVCCLLLTDCFFRLAIRSCLRLSWRAAQDFEAKKVAGAATLGPFDQRPYFRILLSLLEEMNKPDRLLDNTNMQVYKYTACLNTLPI